MCYASGSVSLSVQMNEIPLFAYNKTKFLLNDPNFPIFFLHFQTTIKVYTACLRLDIEYKTLGIQWDTTSKDVVTQILRR